MNSFHQRLFLVVALAIAPLLVAAKPPNVLFISIDDLNDVPGFMQRYPDALTPAMDRLAAQGVVFTNAHSQYPLCGPSRASLMTGLLPGTLGFASLMPDSAVAEAASEHNVPLLNRAFAQHGYKTFAVGKIFHHHVPEGTVDQSGGRGGFNDPTGKLGRRYSHEGTSTDWAAAPERDELLPDTQAADWAIDRLNEDHDQPFMLMVGFLRPHVAWYVPQKWYDLYPDPEALELPPYRPDDLDDVSAFAQEVNLNRNTPTTEWALEHGYRAEIMQAYLACVSFVDHQVGRVLQALEASPYADHTIIVLFSDHGYHLGEKNRYQKNSLWERSSRIPLVFAGPGIQAGQRSDRAVGLVDIYPTLLEVAGLPPEPTNEGRSLVPLMKDPARPWPYPVVTEYYGTITQIEPSRNVALQLDGYRYLHYADGSEELYDHRTDPHEWNNLAGDPDQKDRLIEFHQAIPVAAPDFR